MSIFKQLVKKILNLFQKKSFELANKVRWEELNHRQKLWAMTRCEKWAEIPVKTFPIKKRINTGQFIDSNKGLYIWKGYKETKLNRREK